MDYTLVIEAISNEQAQERTESLFEGRFGASIQRIVYLFMNRYAVSVRIDALDTQLEFAWEGALNTIMGESYLVWWNRVTTSRSDRCPTCGGPVYYGLPGRD